MAYVKLYKTFDVEWKDGFPVFERLVRTDTGHVVFAPDDATCAVLRLIPSDVKGIPAVHTEIVFEGSCSVPKRISWTRATLELA